MRLIPIGLVLAAVAGCSRPSREALRHTALVEVFNSCKDSVVSFAAQRTEVTEKPAPDGKGPAKRVTTTRTQWGAGCILHEAGYILSNSHMLLFEGDRKAVLHDGSSFPARAIADDPANDLALLKIDAGRPLKPLKLGRSAAVMVGEPAVTIGNPFGIGFTMASGIVSGVHRHVTTEHTHLVDVVQTDASINPGSSGGPLLNVLGEMIGLCTSNKTAAENIGFAIAIDRIRAIFPELAAPEQRYGFILGMDVATDGPPKVTRVAKGSPADDAGVAVGDIVARVGTEPVRSGIDYYLALIGRKGGEALPLKLLRKGKAIETTATLAEVKPLPAEAVEGLVAGLDYTHYHGRWEKLPDFDTLRAVSTGTVAAFGLDKFKGREGFGMKYTGYVEVAADGVYIFSTRSDDGSRLWIGDELVVDNDGLHAAAVKRGFIPLKAGKHRITVAFFEASGDDELEVFYEGPGIRRQPIPASALFRPAPKPAP